LPREAAGPSTATLFLLEFKTITNEKWAGHSPFFFDCTNNLAANLSELLERTVPALGYELVEVDWSPRSRLLRVYIDKPEGVDVEDCARVSNHLTRLFAVEEIEFERLEVSSPGLDRPLTKLADYTRFAGEEAELKLRAPIAGKRKVKGLLRGVEGENVLVETPTGVQSVAFADVGRARLVPKIEWRK
jgi:ribosome maturation factor RimP